MSDQADTAIEFLRKSESPTAGIQLDTVEPLKHNDKPLTKLSARFHFGNAYGDKTFYATYWKPEHGEDISEDSINALVFICHGYAEYLCNDYDEIATLCATQLGGGCLVFGHDHVGHGRTTAGDRVQAKSMDEFVDPIIAHIEAVQQWENCGKGTLPVFLVGHSLGGLISLFTLFKKQEMFSVSWCNSVQSH